ncbi:MAG: redoxin domain-containing protein [Planctomycetota bacterium]
MSPLEHAPDLLGATAWHNVDRPVDLRHDLAGRVVLLLFFAPGCVHSQHALASMAWLDARFQTRPLAVIGVATPRFPADAWLDDVVHALGVRFPIAVDAERSVFDAYGCGAWPTLVLVDGTGRVRFHGGGEPDARAVIDATKTLLAEVEYAGYGSMAPGAVRVDASLSPQSLAQPSGVAVDAARDLLWIADTGHHRLLAVACDTGAVCHVIGGMPGAGDGGVADASLHVPRGLCFDVERDRLVVADTGNHLLRAVDANAGVTTILGTGARAYDRYGGASGVGQGLASPWGVAASPGDLVVAMSGLHQAWTMAVDDGIATARVGTGFAGSTDGVAAHARLSEPHAVAVRGELVAIADTGSHALRLWDRAADAVRTLIGGEPGDVDGELAQARLCAPSGLAFHGEDLLLADTGNGKLKRVDRDWRHIRTLDLGEHLQRPTAVVVREDRAFVADSARNRIVVVDLIEETAADLPILVPAPPVRPARVHLRAQAECVLKVQLPLPAGASVHPDIAVRITLRTVSGQPLAIDLSYEAAVEGSFAVVRGVTTGPPGAGTVRAQLDYHSTHGHGRVAHAQRVHLEATFALDADAPVMAQWIAGRSEAIGA